VGKTVRVLSLYLFLVSSKIAHKPLGFAVTFKNKQMRTYPIKEKSVVADYHCAALKIDYRLLKNPHSADVKVVCRLIERVQKGVKYLLLRYRLNQE
jgi:hypothetical protein